MFGLSLAETGLILLVAVLVIGPKDLPRVIRAIAHGVARAKSVAAEFKQGFDEIAKEAEIDALKDEFLTAMPVITDMGGNPQPTYDIAAELTADKARRAKEQNPPVPEVLPDANIEATPVVLLAEKSHE